MGSGDRGATSSSSAGTTTVAGWTSARLNRRRQRRRRHASRMARAREEQTPAQAGAQLPAADTTPETDPSPAADVQGAEGSGDAAHRRLFGQIFGRGPEGEDQGQ